jgi:cell wall-associated NlpC family hydrolase
MRPFLVVGILVAVQLVTGCGTPGGPSGGRPAASPGAVREPPRGAIREIPPGALASPAKPVPAGAWRGETLAWLGIPYRLGGADRRGIDCSGFVAQVYQKLAGMRLPRTAAAQFQWGRAVDAKNLRAGDLVFFQTEGRSISHVGICLGGNQFIHASLSHGVTISSLREEYYAKRYRGARRLLD